MKITTLTTIVLSSFLSFVYTEYSVAETPQQVPELPPVTVSASPLSPSLLEYGKPASIMDEKEISSRLESTLGETLRHEPGVRSSFFGQGASRPIVRGFAGDRVRVLKNGVTTGDVSDLSEDHVVVADPLQAQQIEILRGPETLLYGSGAIGGAVNVTDDSIPEFSLQKPFEGKFLGQFGNSADNEKTMGIKLRGESGNFNWHISTFSRQTDDYQIPGFAESARLREQEEMHSHEDEEVKESEHEEEMHGRVDNTDTTTWGATVGGSYVWDKGFVGVSVGGFGSEYGIPGHVHAHEEDEHDHEEHEEEVSPEEGDVRIEAKQNRVDLRGRVDEVSDAIETVKFRFGYTDYEHDEIEGSLVGTTYTREAYEQRLELLHAPFAGLRGAFGLQMLYDDFAAVGDEVFLSPVTTLAPAIFLFEEAKLTSTLSLRFGGRVEMVSHDPEGRESQEYTPLSFSAGPLWDLNGKGDYNIGLTFAYTERAPNAVELFAEGQHLARQVYERGDSRLDKEASWGADLVMRKNRGSVTGAITPFYQGFSNYINLSGTGAEDEGLPIFAYEEIDAHFWGFEVESALHVDELLDMGPYGLSLEYQIDYVRARNEEVHTSIPRTPPLRNIVRARYSYQDSLEGFLEGEFVEKQDSLAEYELPTNGYFLLNTELSYKLPFFDKSDVRLFAKGTNLTNDEAREHSSFLKDLAPLRGRAGIVGIRAKL